MYDEKALALISNYFKRTGREFTENNKKQALVLNGATVFANDHGMAPGMGVNKNGKVYILLPGPPKEMKPMYVSYVEPFYVILQQEKTFILVCLFLRYWGVPIRGESARFN